MASLGTDTHAMAPCAAIRGVDAVDKGGLLPAGLAFVPVTLGTTASFMGFFLQESVFRHKEPLVLVFLAGTQLLLCESRGHCL
ncbi:MAG TPA: hypothetical protein PLJ71_17585 [Candidatus Hydrogenedentes bacterium]|nr:hypothetical protein [Candidatus Hydrogenedentota bacterium]HQM50505.1 hypothetical protein [Candidatus Hydrogenedentota bacterium]